MITLSADLCAWREKNEPGWTMKLHSQILGKGDPVIIMHGLFGSSDNWLSIGKQLALHHKCYLLDLRNHGRSPHSPDLNYDDMSEDLL